MIVLFNKCNNKTEKKSSRDDWADLQANIGGRALHSATPVRSTPIRTTCNFTVLAITPLPPAKRERMDFVSTMSGTEECHVQFMH
jgi:hypothetical protein